VRLTVVDMPPRAAPCQGQRPWAGHPGRAAAGQRMLLNLPLPAPMS